MKNTFTFSVAILLALTNIKAQLEISSTGVEVVFDFTGFNGSGFDATGSDGYLDADTWAITGMSDGDKDFGEEATTGDFARGSTMGGVTTGGLYAVDILGNQGIMVQPTETDFTPGSIRLKLWNNTGVAILALEVSYTIYAYNDQNRSGSFNFAHSYDNVTYTDEPSLNYTSGEAATFIPESVTQTIALSGLDILNDEFFYLKWEGNDVGGSGSRDEFALDDISVTVTLAEELPQVFFSPDGYTVYENAGAVNPYVEISAITDCTVHVDINGASTVDASDHDFTPFDIVFESPGSGAFDFLVGINEDVIAELDETLILELSVISGLCAIGSPGTFTVTILDNDDAGPGIQFATSSVIAEEGETLTPFVEIAADADCSVDVNISVSSTAIEGADFDFTEPTILTFTVGGATSYSFSVPTLDDLIEESTESIVLILENATGGCIIGPVNTYSINLLDNDAPTPSISAIADVTTEDINGIAESIGDYVQLTGIVHGINLSDDGGLDFTIIDATGGIRVFIVEDDLGYTADEGDEITVIGIIDQLYGLTLIAPESISLISTGNALTTSSAVTALNENTESSLITIENVTYLNISEWLGDGSSFNLQVSDGTNIFTVRIDNNTNLSSITAPVGMDIWDLTITGLGSQFDLSSPFNEGYQIVPRYSSDIEVIDYLAVDNRQENSITIFPNPILNSFTVEGLTTAGTVELINQLGETVFFTYLNRTNVQMDIQDLLPGMYIAKIKTESGIYTATICKL